jgi:hypothetical protein
VRRRTEIDAQIADIDEQTLHRPGMNRSSSDALTVSLGGSEA